MKNTGVYKIYFKNDPNKVYIGSTSFINSNSNSIKTGFRQRKYNHLNSLRCKTHYNIHLQKAYDLYGEENFIFEILEQLTDNFQERETYWINYYKSSDIKHGYNIKGLEHSCNGYIKSKSHIENHRKALKKYFETNEIYNKKINENLISSVKKLISQNIHYKEICKILNIKKSTYYNIKKLINES